MASPPRIAGGVRVSEMGVGREILFLAYYVALCLFLAYCVAFCMRLLILDGGWDPRGSRLSHILFFCVSAFWKPLSVASYVLGQRPWYPNR